MGIGDRERKRLYEDLEDAHEELLAEDGRLPRNLQGGDEVLKIEQGHRLDTGKQDLRMSNYSEMNPGGSSSASSRSSS